MTRHNQHLLQFYATRMKIGSILFECRLQQAECGCENAWTSFENTFPLPLPLNRVKIILDYRNCQDSPWISITEYCALRVLHALPYERSTDKQKWMIAFTKTSCRWQNRATYNSSLLICAHSHPMSKDCDFNSYKDKSGYENDDDGGGNDEDDDIAKQKFEEKCIVFHLPPSLMNK